MAVPSSPANPATSPSRKRKSKNNVDQVESKSDSKLLKRNNDPGVRVIGGRIYDPQNGKTCHQCRQKTMDFAAECKNTKRDKQCTIKFCHKCLLNRYGEKAEEMAALDDWKCPKCRGICNCSFCMKRKGHKPTGILVYAAKATGFSSVSELLNVKGPEVCQEASIKNKIASPKKSTALTGESVVASPMKRGKENSFDGSCNTNASSQPLAASPNEKKIKKLKKKALKERVGVAKDNGVVNSPKKNAKEGLLRCPIRAAETQEIAENEMKNDISMVTALAANKGTKKENVKTQKVKHHKHKKHAIMDDKYEDIVLPQGSLIESVAGINLLPEDVGHVLQFLEFSATFGEVLGLRKGQPESVLRDIMCGRSTRKGKCTSAVQFLIQLVSFILEDMEESQPQSPSDSSGSWVDGLKRCLSESEFEPEDIPEGCFDKGCTGYERLESSQKLKLLTFLCDEALCTIKMRDWINDEHVKFLEQAKESKDIVNAAKEKEKLTKKKLQDEVAKAIIAKNGIPLTISEHESIVSEIKAEAKRAREDMLVAKLANKKQKAHAVRTEPVFIDDKGCACWKLKCYGDRDLILQDIGSLESIAANDKWFCYNAEEAKLVEKQISLARLKRHQRNKLANPTEMKNSSSDPEADSSSNDNSPSFP